MASGSEKVIREYLARIGRKGGKARAARHSKAELSKWGKMGGRPQKAWSQLSESGKRVRKRRAEKPAKGGE
jgi:general stress protein YciG